MRYRLKTSEKRLEGLRCEALRETGATVFVKAVDGTYEVTFGEDGMNVRGGLAGRKPVQARLLGTGSNFGTGLYLDRIDSCGRVEFDLFRTDAIQTVTIVAPRRVIRQALFNTLD